MHNQQILSVFFIIGVIAVGLSGAERFPPGASSADKKLLSEMQREVSYSRYLQMFIGEYSDRSGDILLSFLRHGSAPVRERSATLLVQWILQYAPRPEYQDRILAETRGLDEDFPKEGSAGRILWALTVAGKSSEKDKLVFIEESLFSEPLPYDIVPEACAQLSALTLPEAGAALERLVVMVADRPELKTQAVVHHRIHEVRRDLQGEERTRLALAMELLHGKVNIRNRLPKSMIPEIFERQVRAAVLRELGSHQGPATLRFLENIRNDEDLHIVLRLEAQSLLINDGVIFSPSEMIWPPQ